MKLSQWRDLLGQPVKDGVEVDDVEALVREAVQGVRVADLEDQVRARLLPCDLDSQRQGVDADHRAP
jgi:hypothetical protein